MASPNDTVEQVKTPAVPGMLTKQSLPLTLPLLTASQVVIYPNMTAPLVIDDKAAIDMIEAVSKSGQTTVALFGLIAKSEEVELADNELTASDLYPGGVCNPARQVPAHAGRPTAAARPWGPPGSECSRS